MLFGATPTVNVRACSRIFFRWSGSEVLSQGNQRRSDEDNAVKRLEKAVELHPVNRGFTNQLGRLKDGVWAAFEPTPGQRYRNS